ncbi:MAG: helix-turn-helix domain-containing protein [Candidatus Woesearchaeota archaeon]
MVVQLLHPQELEVFYILPALRREIAKAMKKLGRSQKAIAQMLGVTEAAVSQYLHQKRATDVDFTKDLQKDIHESAASISNRNDFVRTTQQIIRTIRENKFICTVCRNQNKSASKRCAICFE